MQLKIGNNSPDHLIDIKKIPGVKKLHCVKTEDGQSAQQFLAYNLLIIKSYQGMAWFSGRNGACRFCPDPKQSYVGR